MKLFSCILFLAGSAAMAEDAKLDAGAITALLTGRTLTYDDGSRQVFKADGDTLYDNGRSSTGQWNVQGDRYCSVWPPSDHWACYDVRATQGNRVWVWVVALKFFDMGFRYRTRRGTPFVPNMFSYFTHGFPNAIAL